MPQLDQKPDLNLLDPNLDADAARRDEATGARKPFFRRSLSQGRPLPQNIVASKLKRPSAIRAAQLDRHRACIIMDVVAMSTGVALNDLKSHTRASARAARARQICIYLSSVTFDWSMARIGRAFERDRSTAAYACHLIEDLRDDDAFDARLSQLEACIENLPKAKEVKLLSPNLREMLA